ncbi:hypothetical protein LWI29_003794 [Acer saccharum]|uniref:Uncharacterized protein n=1 Tax=Acer saccharum TaxID=4024 RepID=A0AA39SX78_ACESA|nr:hypothetical protein LWI29_003794 [Acer saccharum]
MLEMVGGLVTNPSPKQQKQSATSSKGTWNPLPESDEEWPLKSTSVEKLSHEWNTEEDDNVLDENVYSSVEFTLIRTLEEKSEPSNALPSDALSSDDAEREIRIVRYFALQGCDALGFDVHDEEVYSLVEFTLIWTPEEKSEPSDALPYDALGYAVLDEEVYSPVEFTLIRMSEEKSEPPNALPSDALGSADAADRRKGNKKGKGKKKKNRN